MMKNFLITLMGCEQCNVMYPNDELDKDN